MASSAEAGTAGNNAVIYSPTGATITQPSRQSGPSTRRSALVCRTGALFNDGASVVAMAVPSGHPRGQVFFDNRV